MPIVAEKYQFVVGVDTHAKKHLLCLINNLGEKLGVYECRVLEKDFRKLLAFLRKKTSNGVNTQKILFAIEGTSSYGETFTRFLEAEGEMACEVAPPKTKQRAGIGKNDPIDAEFAARGVLHLRVDRLVIPRAAGYRKQLRTLLASRDILTKQCTMNKNALNALVRSSTSTTDSRKSLSNMQIEQLRRCRGQGVGDREARRLAGEINRLMGLIISNERELLGLVTILAKPLLDCFGVGAVCAARFICAYSHKGRIRSAAAFASLAGVAPIPASSGNVVRHRLNHFGDRMLNQALDVVARARMNFEPRTKTYVEKRTADGKTRREVRRLIKCYIAKNMFKRLESLNLGVD